MKRDAVKRPMALAALAVMVFITVFGITRFGVTGPDEPRYSSIGRAMAQSGDWITPRLWGAPWFEKPALLYWLDAAAFRTGLNDDVAPRLPIALCAVAFLAFYFYYLRLEFNSFVAWVATALLATSAMWLAFAHVAVTDLPLTAAFAAAILLALPAVEGRPAAVTGAAFLLGCAVLAKGLVPLVLAVPFLWFARRYWRSWLRPLPVIVFLAATLPWYVLCQIRNPGFFRVFFLQHQLGRFTSPEMQHVQPWWFYVPVLVGAFFPSIPLALFAFGRRAYHDRRRRFLATVVVWGFVFFSASRNKLPGYLLPLAPLVCILAAAGIECARDSRSRWLPLALRSSALLLPLFAFAGGHLAAAAGAGLHAATTGNYLTTLHTAIAIPMAVMAAMAFLFVSRERALIGWFALACCGWFYVEWTALPQVDRMASARSVWRELPEPKHNFCVGNVSRSWRYGLNYYAVTPLPDCASGVTSQAIMPGASPSARPQFSR